jgi:hypothetical protein
MDRIMKEVTEIQLHPRNFKREAGFKLSQTWKSIINTLHKLTKHNTADNQGQPMNNQTGSRSAQCHNTHQSDHQSPGSLMLCSAPQPETDINTGLQDTRPPVATQHPEDGDTVSSQNIGEF